MPDPSPKLRVVGCGEPPPHRGKGPGLAVILVGLYALAFAGALWLIRGHASNARRWAAPAPGSPGAAAAAAGRPDRQGLLSGAGLEAGAHTEYARGLAADCCDCGCELTLRECLTTDEKCTRSAEIAGRRLAEFK
jgi:hypothetical protein